MEYQILSLTGMFLVTLCSKMILYGVLSQLGQPDKMF